MFIVYFCGVRSVACGPGNESERMLSAYSSALAEFFGERFQACLYAIDILPNENCNECIYDLYIGT